MAAATTTSSSTTSPRARATCATCSGGKGANVAEMTRVLGAERVPAGFTITTEACVAYMEAGREEPAGARGAGGRGARAPRGAGRQAARATRTTRCSCRCARARASRCPACSTRSSTSGSGDESVEGLAQRDRTTSASPGTPTGASCRCSATSAAACRASASRTRSRSARRAAGVKLDTELSVDDLKALTAALQGALPRPDRRGLPAGAARAAAPGDRRGVRLVDGRPRRGVPAHQPDPGRLGHRGERAADGVRQQGRHLVLGRGLLARRDHRRAAAERRLPAERPGRGRGVGRAHAARPARAEGRAARRLRGADGDPAPSSSATTATCRTPSSRWRRAASTCSRRATPSARPRRRCASRSTRWRRGCSTRPGRSRTIEAGRLDALLHPTIARDAEYDVLAEGVAASPGAAKGAIVFTARGGRGRGRRATAT